MVINLPCRAEYDAAVVAAGGPLKYLQTVSIPRLDQCMKDIYAFDPNSLTEQVRSIFGSCRLSIKNGVPGFY